MPRDRARQKRLRAGLRASQSAYPHTTQASRQQARGFQTYTGQQEHIMSLYLQLVFALRES